MQFGDLAVPPHPSDEHLAALAVPDDVVDPAVQADSNALHAGHQRRDVVPAFDHVLRLVSSKGEALHIFVRDSVPGRDDLERKIRVRLLSRSSVSCTHALPLFPPHLKDHGGVVAKSSNRAQYILVDQDDPQIGAIVKEYETLALKGKPVDCNVVVLESPLSIAL
jgi:hypothetical protein